VPIPDFQSCMLPVLELAGDGKVRALVEARQVLAHKFALTDQELNELLPSGRQRRFNNRVAWAKVYLEQAGLLSTPKRGHFAITDRGRSLLLERPPRIDISLLERYPEFQEFRNASRKDDSSSAPSIGPEASTASHRGWTWWKRDSVRHEFRTFKKSKG
jgi:restriction system protein